jgi:hypothetical protein
MSRRMALAPPTTAANRGSALWGGPTVDFIGFGHIGAHTRGTRSTRELRSPAATFTCGPLLPGQQAGRSVIGQLVCIKAFRRTRSGQAPVPSPSSTGRVERGSIRGESAQ